MCWQPGRAQPRLRQAMPGELLDAQGFAADMAALEQQFGQRARAQPRQGFPGTVQCAVRSGAARPDHRHAVQQQHDFAHMAAQAGQVAAFLRPQALAALALHPDLDHAMGPQPRGERAGGGQPGVQRSVGRMGIVSLAAGQAGGGGTR